MKKRICLIGGLIGLNNSYIKDCYAMVKLSGGQSSGGFIGCSYGEIYNSWSLTDSKRGKVMAGFAAKNEGIMEHIFYIDDRKKKKKKFADIDLEMDIAVIKQLPWDYEHCWNEAEWPPRFREDCFHIESACGDDVIEINTGEDLIEAAEGVNSGERHFQYACFRLNADIDLQGKSISPIGEDDTLPFKGIFDGGNHIIKNFKIKGKRKYGGLFGYLKDAKIINLTVDAMIQGAEYSGGIAGVMEGGIICCCGSAVRIEAKKYAGGLVGKNREGILVKDYAVGVIHKQRRPWFLLLFLIPLLLFLLKLGIPYPSIPVDGNVQAIHDGLKPEGGNTAAFEFNRLIVFTDGKGQIDFYNPGNSTQDIVVKLTISDQELIDKLGENHRTFLDQRRLSLLGDYDPSLFRQELAMTGRVPAGSRLETLELSTLQDGTELPPGTYRGIIELVFYDSVSQEKALLNSQLPVGIEIQ